MDADPDRPERRAAEQIAAPDASMAEQVGALGAATRNWLSDSIGLALLDGQLAGVSLVRMLIYGLIAFLLFVTGWFALMLALALYLDAIGLPLALVVLIVGLLGIATGALLVLRITALSRNVTFSSTRQHLRTRSSAHAADRNQSDDRSE